MAVAKKTTEKKETKKKAKVGIKAKPPKKAAKEELKKEAKLRKKPAKEAPSPKRYFEAVGRRKTSTARTRLFTQGKKGVIVNDQPLDKYFPTLFLQKTVLDPLEKLKCQEKFGVVIKVKGGGISGQAEACRHGISRALVALNPYFKKRLKKSGFLTRDPRMRERKKPGLKRARRAPQWSKR